MDPEEKGLWDPKPTTTVEESKAFQGKLSRVIKKLSTYKDKVLEAYRKAEAEHPFEDRYYPDTSDDFDFSVTKKRGKRKKEKSVWEKENPNAPSWKKPLPASDPKHTKRVERHEEQEKDRESRIKHYTMLLEAEKVKCKGHSDKLMDRLSDLADYERNLMKPNEKAWKQLDPEEQHTYGLYFDWWYDRENVNTFTDFAPAYVKSILNSISDGAWNYFFLPGKKYHHIEPRDTTYWNEVYTLSKERGRVSELKLPEADASPSTATPVKKRKKLK